MLLAPGAQSAFAQDHGLMRLANMEVKAGFWAGAVPTRYEDPHSNEYYLRHMREQILQYSGGVVPRAFFDRLEGAISRFENPEPWMVLATEDIPRAWRDIVSESIEDLEDDAIRILVALGQSQGKYGTIECLRLIHHMVKDRSSGKRPNNRWVISSCREATRALRTKQAWDGSKGAGRGSSQDDQEPRQDSQGDQGPSSSSGQVQGHR